MKKRKLTYNFICAILFLAVVMFLGLSSDLGLARYYITDVVNYNEWTPEAGNKLEVDYITSFWNKVGFIDLNGWVRRHLGIREMNHVVRMNNEYLVVPMEEISQDVIEHRADQILDLQNRLAEKDIAFLFTAVPEKVQAEDPQLPAGIEDFGNQNQDAFVSALQARGVSYLDLRESMREDGIDYYGSFFRTDHHWTTKGGFYAYTKLTDWIQSATGKTIQPQVQDLSQYEITTYPGWFLGSEGQRTGNYFSDADDFDLITPKFDTHLIREMSYLHPDEGSVEGGFEDLVISHAALQEHGLAARYTYDTTLNESLGHFVNPESGNDLKLLILEDSFGKAVNPYLILSAKETTTVITDFAGSFASLVEEYQPDAVLYLQYPDYLDRDDAFEFGY